jgi:hypothetical protein
MPESPDYQAQLAASAADVPLRETTLIRMSTI